MDSRGEHARRRWATLLLLMLSVPAAYAQKSDPSEDESIEELEAQLQVSVSRRLALQREKEILDAEIAELEAEIEERRASTHSPSDALLIRCRWTTKIYADASILADEVAEAPRDGELVVWQHHAANWFRVEHLGSAGFAILRLAEQCRVMAQEKAVPLLAASCWQDSGCAMVATLSSREVQERTARLEREAIEQKEQLEREREERAAEQKAEREREAAERKIRLQSKYGAVVAARILAGKIWLGMTTDMAIESVGTPTDVNRTVVASGVREQWVYRTFYLYFDDGILTAWQD